MTHLNLVPVKLREKSYDVLVGPGLIESAGERIVDLLGPRKIFMVTD